MYKMPQLPWLKTYKFLGKHRHLRRMRRPYFKLKFAILCRAVPVILLMLPFLIPYVVLLIDQMVNERLLDWYDEHKRDGNIFHKTAVMLGLEALMDREEKLSKHIWRWRRKMNVGLPRVGKPIKPNADEIFIENTINTLKSKSEGD